MGRGLFNVICLLFALRIDKYGRSHSVSRFLATLDFNLSRATEEVE
jgi:hypothetical protein